MPVPHWLLLNLLLLVSDGVTFHLCDDALAACFKSGDLAANVQKIFDELMAQGAEDNVSAVVIAIH
jgi:serine/threonine protein phosphatase PrpC